MYERVAKRVCGFEPRKSAIMFIANCEHEAHLVWT